MIGSKVVAKSVFHAKNTIEFWKLCEQLNTPNFKRVEFDYFRNEAGANAFTLSFIYLIQHQKKAVKNV